MSNTKITDKIIGAKDLEFPADKVYEEVCKENEVNAECAEYANRVDELGPEK